jgi:hypothetical protein
LWVSLATIALQAVLTLGGIVAMQRLGFNSLFQAAAAAAALMVALGLSSLAKGRLLSTILGEPINNWRLALFWAAAPAVAVGFLAVRFLPEWAALAFGIPAILGTYFLIIWKKAFGPEDRRLFQKSKPV